MLQLGRKPSHLSLRFRQIMQARRLGLGTLALSGTALSRGAESASISSGGVGERISSSCTPGAMVAPKVRGRRLDVFAEPRRVVEVWIRIEL